MIIRRHKNHLLLITQHHHAGISGIFAGHWKVTDFHGFDRLEEVLFTIHDHDKCWQSADKEPLFNKATSLPYSFEDYPEKPKIDLYSKGIDNIEKEQPYAGLLCSKHFAAFFATSSTAAGQDFHNAETTRQQKLIRQIDLQEKDLEALEFHFQLLQFCDNLSLFICMSQEGETPHPWFKSGLPGSEKLGIHPYPLQASWKNRGTVSVKPFPFDEPFSVTLEYRQIPADIPDQDSLTQYWNDARPETKVIRFQ